MVMKYTFLNIFIIIKQAVKNAFALVQVARAITPDVTSGTDKH